MKKVLVVFIYLFIMSCSKNDDTQTVKVETYAITNNPTNIVYATYAGHGGFEECQGDGCKEAGACFLGWDIVLFESEQEALNYSRNNDLAARKLGKSSITIHCGKYSLTGKQNPNIAFAGIASVLATSN